MAHILCITVSLLLCHMPVILDFIAVALPNWRYPKYTHSTTISPPPPSRRSFHFNDSLSKTGSWQYIVINQQITRLPVSSFTLPSRHSFHLQEGDSSPTNQRAAQIITHLGPPPFLIYVADKWCLFSALIARSFHRNLMFVSCRFLGGGCEHRGYNFYIKEVVMND